MSGCAIGITYVNLNRRCSEKLLASSLITWLDFLCQIEGESLVGL